MMTMSKLNPNETGYFLIAVHVQLVQLKAWHLMVSEHSSQHHENEMLCRKTYLSINVFLRPLKTLYNNPLYNKSAI